RVSRACTGCPLRATLTVYAQCGPPSDDWPIGGACPCAVNVSVSDASATARAPTQRILGGHGDGDRLRDRRQADREAGATLRLRAHRDLAAVVLDDLPHDRESEPAAPARPRAALVGAP